MTFSEQIKALMQAHSLTQHQIAAALEITPEWLSKILRGHRTASRDVPLRLDSFPRSTGGGTPIEHSSIPSTPLAETSHAPDSVSELVQAIAYHHGELMAAAKNVPERLGWIREQQRAHLAIPEHWGPQRPGYAAPVRKSVTPQSQTTRPTSVSGKAPHQRVAQRASGSASVAG